MKLVSNVGIWNIVAHIAFKFYSSTSGTFSTPSTTAFTAGPAARNVMSRKTAMRARSSATSLFGLTCANDSRDFAQRLSYSSWRRHQTPVSLRPLGARSSQWYMPKNGSTPRA